MARYKVFPATEHRKHSNRFEVWDTELQQCKGQWIGREAAQYIADQFNVDEAFRAGTPCWHPSFSQYLYMAIWTNGVVA